MNIRSCLMHFAKIIGEDKKADAIKFAREITDEFEDLVQIMQMAVKHLCATKVDYIKEIKIKSRNKVLHLSHIEDKYFHITGVFKFGERVDFKFGLGGDHDHIYVAENGIYEVRYSSYPNFYNLDEEMDQLIAPYYKAIYLSSCALWFLKKEQFAYYKSFHNDYAAELEYVEGGKNERVGNKSQRK